MSEQDETILNADDTEGHRFRGQDEDDTEGHIRHVRQDEAEDDDTEGHFRHVRQDEAEEDDTEGHRVR